jgi:RHS repeat-associated protein
MPRGSNSNTQTRTFSYITGSTVGINLLSATNPENGTVTYTYNSDNTLHTKTDAKSQVFTYSYDSYKRLTQIMVGSTVLRTFMYDTNTLDGTFSGSYTQGRLVAVQNQAFTPQGYIPGIGGSNISVPSSMQFVEMYAYTQAGLTSGKRLQVQETLHYYINGVAYSDPQSLNMDTLYTYDTGGEGKVLSVNYPETWAWSSQSNTMVSTAGPTYTYSFDAMYRPTGLKDQNNNTIVNNVTYNAANQLLTFNTETRSYNNLNQMTQLVITGTYPLNISYNFTAGQNNGKIASQTDNLSGETVTYQYDSLNRLITATSSQSWGETYGFDSFGNLLSKTGTGGAPTLSQSVSTATNQIVGQTYDANGNQVSSPLGTLTYDAENRVASMASAGVQYAYDSRNKRIWRSILSGGNLAQQVYVYGVDGQKIGTYTFTLGQYGENVLEMTNSTVLLAQFFGRKRVGVFDRLGSAKYNQSNNQAQSFYPYGEDRGTVEPNDELKFATYTRDAASGLDYADQRYYASNFGRFMSPDPYKASGGPRSPASWNRYTYAIGDPVNGTDPSGRYACDPDDPDCPVDECTPGDGDCSPGPEPQPGPGGEPGITAGIPPGLLGPWTYGGDNTFGLALPFADGGAVAVGVCVAQPELCLAVGVGAVVTIYVLAPGIRALIEAIQSQITSREAAPVYFPPYNPGRDSNGNCKPPDRSKYVKWQGTGGNHWHWIDWNQDLVTCWTYGVYMSGPNDPGPMWTEIPR